MRETRRAPQTQWSEAVENSAEWHEMRENSANWDAMVQSGIKRTAGLAGTDCTLAFDADIALSTIPPAATLSTIPPATTLTPISPHPFGASPVYSAFTPPRSSRSILDFSRLFWSGLPHSTLLYSVLLRSILLCPTRLDSALPYLLYRPLV
ncbi:hypothetical protein GQ42DRAFT_30326 [Ramicandelaber brevisporus]|nr:hypothetical protein GQ42DRAFT_30326 [Ramicandelaber brevisporus]